MSERPAQDKTPVDVTRSLRMARLGAWSAMIVERLWPLLLPFLVIATLYSIIAWFGLFRSAPDQTRLGLAAILAIGALGALTLLRHFRLPRAAEIDARLEAANQLQHAPLRVQTEQLGGQADTFADALWREHQRRMAEKLRAMSADRPRPNIPAYDKWALRAFIPLLAFTAFAFSFGSSGGSFTDAFRPAAAQVAEAPRIDAWITPPKYTGKAPIFLTAQANRDTREFTVPIGSELSLRVTGGSGDEAVTYSIGGNEQPVAPNDQPKPADVAQPARKPANQQFTLKLTDNGEMTLKQGEAALKRWSFSVIPDKPPTIRFSDEPRQALNGVLELHYEITDDYGAASASANLALIEPPKADARPLFEKPEIKLALPRAGAKPPVARVNPDLTKHIWAGAPVSLILSATDALGQEARTEVKKFVLPQRPFMNPLARAVIEMRRIIGLDANQRPVAEELLDAITLRPEDTIDNPTHYLALMSLRSRMNWAKTDDELRDVVAYMWEIAVGIEDGAMSAAEQRLRQAQQALKDALERGASEEEIAKLMKELRQAMSEYLREFAERAQKNQNAQQQPFNGKLLSERDLQKMLDEIEKQAQSGNRDQAQALLDQLQNLMNNLQAARPGQNQQGGQQGQAQQQMNKLGELMRRQQEMMNETHRLDKQRNGQQDQQGQNGDQQQGQKPGGGQNPNGQMSEQDMADAMKRLEDQQGQLQKELDQLQEEMKGMGMQPGKGFPDASQQMGEAQQSLGQSQGEQATGHQGQALEALRRGARDMMQQMQQAEGDQGEGEGMQRDQKQVQRDPLNRPLPNGGIDDGNDADIDGTNANRSREILDAIRKRLGDSLSPELEKQYLERLLDLQ